MAALYPDRYDSPLSLRLIGVVIDQDDDPWWVVAILGWLGMYRAIRQASGRQAEVYRAALERKMSKEPPDFLYVFYRNWAAAMEAES